MYKFIYDELGLYIPLIFGLRVSISQGALLSLTFFRSIICSLTLFLAVILTTPYRLYIELKLVRKNIQLIFVYLKTLKTKCIAKTTVTYIAYSQVSYKCVTTPVPPRDLILSSALMVCLIRKQY